MLLWCFVNVCRSAIIKSDPVDKDMQVQDVPQICAPASESEPFAFSLQSQKHHVVDDRRRRCGFWLHLVGKFTLRFPASNTQINNREAEVAHHTMDKVSLRGVSGVSEQTEFALTTLLGGSGIAHPLSVLGEFHPAFSNDQPAAPQASGNFLVGFCFIDFDA